MVGKELIQGIPASAPAGCRHVSALAACLWGFRSTVSSDTLRRRWRCARPHGIWQHWPGAGQHYTAARVVPIGYPSSSSLRGPPACTARIPARPGRVPALT
jgi:hypothetical protein